MNSATGGNIIYKFIGDKSGLESTTNSVNNGMKGMTKSVFLANVATKAFSAGLNLIRNNAGEAVSRLDTLNNFPRVMSNLGIGADEAQKSIKKMSDKLMGLPTTLDAGAMAVQRFTSKNGDVKKSTDIFLALNNAILAGGASTEIQANALEQISQAYAKGKPDMMEWRTLMTAMPAQLKQVAQAMGYTDAAMLGVAVRADGGEAEFSRMIDTMLRMNTEGVKGFKSFEQQAKNSTDGMKTNLMNAKNAVVRGVASMMTAVNKGLEKAGLGNMGELLLQAGKKIEQLLNRLAPYITAFITKLVEVYKWIDKHKTLIMAIIIPILTMIATVKTLIGVMTALKTAMLVINAVMAINPFVLIVAAIIGLIALFVYLWNKCEGFRKFWIGLWNGIKTAFLVVATALKVAFKAVVDYFKWNVNAVKTVALAIVNAFKSIPGKLLSIGRNIVQGLWNGIQGMKSWVINKVKSLGSSIVKGLKNALGIHSPSTEFAMIGRFSVLGYTEALDKMQGDIQDKVKETFGISPQLTGAMNNHFSPNVMVNNDINVSTDPLGQTVKKIKTFSGGAKNDYNYGMGV